jgi:hypothetical protein
MVSAHLEVSAVSTILSAGGCFLFNNDHIQLPQGSYAGGSHDTSVFRLPTEALAFGGVSWTGGWSITEILIRTQVCIVRNQFEGHAAYVYLPT